MLCSSTSQEAGWEGARGLGSTSLQFQEAPTLHNSKRLVQALGVDGVQADAPAGAAEALQGYLAHKKTPPPRTLQEPYAWGPMVVLGGGAVSYERGTPVRP